VDLLDSPEDVAELHFGLGSLQEQGCNDHIEDNWADDLLLEDKVRGELETSRVHNLRRNWRKLVFLQELLQVDWLAKGHVQLAILLPFLLPDHAEHCRSGQLITLGADNLTREVANFKHAVRVDRDGN